jgi:hypothetical protein
LGFRVKTFFFFFFFFFFFLFSQGKKEEIEIFERAFERESLALLDKKLRKASYEKACLHTKKTHVSTITTVLFSCDEE